MSKGISICIMNNGFTVRFDETVDCKDGCDYLDESFVYTHEMLEAALLDMIPFIKNETALQRIDGEVKLVPTS